MGLPCANGADEVQAWPIGGGCERERAQEALAERV
jgi:hypothetical protein